MSIDELEAEVMRLSPEGRARLAERLLASLDELSAEENERLWETEAARRNGSWSVADSARTSEAVFRNARKRLP